MKAASATDKLTNLLVAATAVIIVLLPFHAILTTWLGSNFGQLDVFRVWKEILLAVMTPLTLVLVYRTPALRQWFKQDLLVKLIGLYALMHLLRGWVALINHQVTAEAFIYSLIINLRYLLFFLMVYAIASRNSWLRNHLRQILLWPAVVVISFGLLQLTVLPNDFLRHFGYGPQTIPAVQTVDQKVSYRRLQSTLRGANPLGAYLLLVIVCLVGWFKKISLQQKLPLLALLATLILLFFTYSRSAWIGLIFSLVLLVWLRLKNPARRRQLVMVAAAAILLFSGFIWTLRSNNTVQNALFHTDETSLSSESSNQARWDAQKHGIVEVIKEPLGGGPGTAGPASFRNDHAPRIAENYFIQIGQEIGIFGLVILVAINAIIASRLWARREESLPMILFCSLVGLTIVNLFLHAWTDDTLSLIWWGLAGIVLASPPSDILNKKRKQDEKSPKKAQ